MRTFLSNAHAVPGAVGALSATTRVFSILVTWNIPLVPNGIIIAYEVHSMGEQENRIQNITTDSQFIELTRLGPQTTYRIAVRAYTVAGAGVWANISATTERIRTYLDVSAGGKCYFKNNKPLLFYN